MGGCCCCCVPKSAEHHNAPTYFPVQYPASEERQPLSSQPAVVSTSILVDTNLDTSIPDTYHAPPAPLPYEIPIVHPPMQSWDPLNVGNKGRVPLQTTNTIPIEGTNDGSTLVSKVNNLGSNAKGEVNIEMTAMEDENSDDLKKPTEPFIPPPEDEEDLCPTCLEEYDEENPKMITKCEHHFHLACILEWMERSDTCPVCDQEMVFSPAE